MLGNEVELSEYEKKRLRQIQANKEKLQALGLDKAAEDARLPPKPKRVKTVTVQHTAPGPSRRSRRVSGVPAADDADAADDDDIEYRDPNDPGQMTDAERSALCTALREDIFSKLEEQLTEEQKERVNKANDAWLGPFAEHIAQFGSEGGGPLSKANLRSVVKQVMRLVSGAGLTTDKRGGSFAEGRPLTLGITAAMVDALRAEAQASWLPHCWRHSLCMPPIRKPLHASQASRLHALSIRLQVRDCVRRRRSSH